MDDSGEQCGSPSGAHVHALGVLCRAAWSWHQEGKAGLRAASPGITTFAAGLGGI